MDAETHKGLKHVTRVQYSCTCTCTYPLGNDRWGTTDVAALSLHFILSSTSLTAWQNFNPVHSAMLFSQHFFCQPLLLPPCAVPFQKHLISVACNFFRMSAVKVQVSQAYNSTEITRERISLIFELREICLSLQMVFSLASASVVCAILDSTSGLEP